MYERWWSPPPGRPLWQGKRSPPRSTRGPAGGRRGQRRPGTAAAHRRRRGRAIPPAITRSTHKRYRRSPAVTDIHEFPGKGHSPALDGGWEEVAGDVLGWLRSHGHRAALAARCHTRRLRSAERWSRSRRCRCSHPRWRTRASTPAVRLVCAPVPRRPHPRPARGVAAHRGRRRHAHRRPHRVGQDAGRLPGRHRQAVPGPRPGRRRGRQGPGGLRVPAQGPGRRHRREPGAPLREIAEVAAELGYDAPDLRGRAHRRHHDQRAGRHGAAPAQLRVTTPESLYLLVTAPAAGRCWLRSRP